MDFRSNMNSTRLLTNSMYKRREWLHRTFHLIVDTFQNQHIQIFDGVLDRDDNYQVALDFFVVKCYKILSLRLGTFEEILKRMQSGIDVHSFIVLFLLIQNLMH